ncbi:hypothetical protein MRB53_042096 [Persea americana]|nr:hypothetical protein MRB53_042096 [Persea americana]
MRSRNIEPTVHTFKLLIDAHATLEPVDMNAAKAVLVSMKDAGIQPEAVHYASLIHAQGCVMHDMEGARQIFNDLVASDALRLQPCVYQAMFESFNANHMARESESLLADMAAKRVEYTAYIANALIHGWTMEKDIVKARAAFDRVKMDKREPTSYARESAQPLALASVHEEGTTKPYQQPQTGFSSADSTVSKPSGCTTAYERIMENPSIFVAVLDSSNNFHAEWQLDHDAKAIERGSWSSWRAFDITVSKSTTSLNKFINPYGDDFISRQQSQQNLSRTLVVAKTKVESISWISDELSGELGLHYAIYVADDDTAPLHVPVNKGRESMVYLSYIIDHYDDLPDVSMFMHSHGEDMAQQRSDGQILSIHRQASESEKGDDNNPAIRMNRDVATAFKQLFPHDEMPKIFSQPCCAQFAVSKEAITRTSKQKYIAMRDWLITTDMADHVSGRIFEFIWHYIFTSEGNIMIWLVHSLLCDSNKVMRCMSLLIGWRREIARRKEEAFNNGGDSLQRQHILSESWKQLDLAARSTSTHVQSSTLLSKTFFDLQLEINRHTFTSINKAASIVTRLESEFQEVVGTNPSHGLFYNGILGVIQRILGDEKASQKQAKHDRDVAQEYRNQIAMRMSSRSWCKYCSRASQTYSDENVQQHMM